MPGPRPHWFAYHLDGIDLMVLAAQFDDAAKETYGQDLRHHFANASGKFAEAGLPRVQPAIDETERTLEDT